MKVKKFSELNSLNEGYGDKYDRIDAEKFREFFPEIVDLLKDRGIVKTKFEDAMEAESYSTDTLINLKKLIDSIVHDEVTVYHWKKPKT